MTASADERGQLLEPVLDDARRQLGALQAEIKDHEAEAHNAYCRGDTPAGDAHHEKAAGLKPALTAASARLQTLEEAAEAVAGQQHREHLEAQHARVSDAEHDALDEARRQQAEIRPAMSAAKNALRLALSAEDLARHLEAERYELEIGLGLRERGRFTPLANAVRAQVERRPDWQRLLHNPEL